MSTLNAKPPTQDAQIFTDKQTNLERVVEYDRSYIPDLQIPLFLHKALDRLFDDGLNYEGLFRSDKPGYSFASLKKRINDGELAAMDFAKEGTNAEDLAFMVKKFLGSSLTEPLLTEAYEETFHSLKSMSDSSQITSTFLFLFSKLPLLNQNVIRELLNFLVQVDANSHTNKMDSVAISKTLSYMSNVFILPRKDSNWILQYLITDYQDLFEKSIVDSAKTPFTLRKLTGHKRSILVIFNLGSDLILSYDSDGLIYIWNARSYKMSHTYSFAAPSHIAPISIELPDKKKEYWFIFQDCIKVKQEEDLINPSKISLEKVINIASIFSIVEVGDVVWAVGEYIHVLDKVTKKEITRINLPSGGSQSYIGYIADHVWFWKDQKFTIWKPSQYAVVKEFIIESLPKPQKCVQHKDNVWIASGRGLIAVLDVKTFTLKTILKAHTGYVYHIEPLGNIMLTTSWDKKILCWNPDTFELLGDIPNRHTDAIGCMILNTRVDGKGWDLWSASFDRSVQVNFVPNDFEKYFGKEALESENPNGTIPTYIRSKIETLPTNYIAPLSSCEIKFCEKSTYHLDDIESINKELVNLRDRVFAKENEMRKTSAAIDNLIQNAINNRDGIDYSKLREDVITQHKSEKNLFLEWTELQVQVASLHNRYRLRIIDELDDTLY